MGDAFIPGTVINGVSEDHNKNFACLPCRQRKVKCDRQEPCTNCVKLSKECTFVRPVRGKRKRTKGPKETLHAKLQRYEELLKSRGEKIEPSGDEESSGDESSFHVANETSNTPGPETVPSADSQSKIIHKEFFSRYFDNTLWSGIGHGFEYPERANLVDSIRDVPNSQFNTRADDSVEHELFMGSDSNPQDLTNLHPPMEIIRRLWDIYLERVDFLIKVVHTPTFWLMLTRVLENPRKAGRSEEALIFAVYTAAISSMDDAECHRYMNDQKSAILQRYRRATREALRNASIIRTSNFMTLQAYVVYLLGMRGIFQSDSFYVLSGIAVRLALRMGLHRDGTSLGLSPFETEMRRRLWWQIVHVDTRSADFSGTSPSKDLFCGDAKPPLNVFDEDLTPNMSKLPPERAGITPIVLTRIRCHILDSRNKLDPHASKVFSWETFAGAHSTVAVKDKMIDEIEDLLENRYLRYIDPAKPLHLFAAAMIRSASCKMRVIAHNPRQFADRGMTIPQADRDIIWQNGLQLLEYGHLMYSTASLTKLTWQVGTGYLWDAVLYVLIEARHRKVGPDVDRTWRLVGCVLDNYPQVFKEATDALYVALGNWAILVWDDCAAARKALGFPEQCEPDYITAIRHRRRPQAQAVALDQSQVELNIPGFDENTMLDFDNLQSYDFSNLLSYDLDSNEWAQWERLFATQGV